MDAVPSGSYLAISQIAGDVAADEVAQGRAALQRTGRCPGRSAFARRGLAGAGDLGNGRNLAIYAGVARKP